MGEYWMPINVTKRERLEPHDLGCGMKLPEWNWPGSPVHKAIEALTAAGRWSETDLIVFASDYRGLKPFRGDGPVPDELYDQAESEYENVSRIAAALPPLASRSDEGDQQQRGDEE